MGFDIKLKQIRGQLRQIVKDVFPVLLTEELKSAAYADLKKIITGRLDAVQKDVENTMNEINQRSKDAQDYLVRNVSAPVPMPTPTAAATTSEEQQVEKS